MSSRGRCELGICGEETPVDWHENGLKQAAHGPESERAWPRLARLAGTAE